jgi:hypothetical protein
VVGITRRCRHRQRSATREGRSCNDRDCGVERTRRGSSIATFERGRIISRTTAFSSPRSLARRASDDEEPRQPGPTSVDRRHPAVEAERYHRAHHADDGRRRTVSRVPAEPSATAPVGEEAPGHARSTTTASILGRRRARRQPAEIEADAETGRGRPRRSCDCRGRVLKIEVVDVADAVGRQPSATRFGPGTAEPWRARRSLDRRRTLVIEPAGRPRPVTAWSAEVDALGSFRLPRRPATMRSGVAIASSGHERRARPFRAAAVDDRPATGGGAIETPYRVSRAQPNQRAARRGPASSHPTLH